MANVYSDEDIWGGPSQGAPTALSDDEVWGNPPPAAPTSAPTLRSADLANMSKGQLLDAYRTLPRDSALREAVKKRLVASTDVPTMNRAQSAVAGATDALSFGFSDEVNAGVDAALGLGGYDDNLRANRQQMRMAQESNPGTYAAGQIGGGLVQAVATGGGSLTGGLAGLARNNVLGATTRAVPAATRMGRIAQGAGNVGRISAEAAASGAIYGFGSGEGGLENRLANAGQEAAVSAVAAPVVGKAIKTVGKTVNAIRGQTPIWSSAELENTSRALYQQAESMGAVIDPQVSEGVGRSLIDQVIQDANYDPAIPEAFTKVRLAMNAVNRSLVQQGGVQTPHGNILPNGPKSLHEMEVLRRRLTTLAGEASSDDEARMISNMRRELDRNIDSLSPQDLLNGSPEAFGVLQDARQVWRVKSDTEWAEEMVNRARSRAGQYSVSKGENALRTEARNASMNAKKMRRAGSEVEAATDRVANPGVVQNLIREAGKWSPFSGVRGPAAGFIAPQFGIPLMAGGVVAQVVSDRMTKKNFRNLQRTIQRNLPPKPVPVGRAERLARRTVPYAVPGLLGSTPDGSITVERTRLDENGNVLN